MSVSGLHSEYGRSGWSVNDLGFKAADPCRHGLLTNHQEIPWASWEIHRADLASEPVRCILSLSHLRSTGRLALKGFGSVGQRELFK